MSVNIAIPNNNISEILITNYDKVKQKYDLNILKVDENRCLDLLIQNKAQIAMLNPLTYGKAFEKLDIRIIPGPALSSASYTGYATIYFKKGMSNLNNFSYKSNIEYLSLTAKLILKEKYNLHPEKVKSFKNDADIKDYDVKVSDETDKFAKMNLDVSEEWFDLYEAPLPIYFWVCRAEEFNENSEEIIISLLKKTKQEKSIKEKLPKDAEYFPREGAVMLKLTQGFENALENTLQLLFFHQYFKNIPAIKVLGREEVKDYDNKIDIDKIDI